MRFAYEALRTARLDAGLSLRSLEALSGVSRDTLHRAETGRTAPSADTLARILCALRVDPREVFADPETNGEKSRKETRKETRV